LETHRTPATSRWLHALVVGLGILVWLIPWAFLNRMEAWDHSSYFLVSLPMMVVACVIAGFHVPLHPWRWPLILFLVQMVTMLLLGGGPGNLFPLGLVALAIFCVPLALAAWVGAWWATRSQKKHAP